MTEETMADRIGASPSGPVHPLIERVLTSKIPVAELIGFGVEEIGGGRAVASLRSVVFTDHWR
jgi:hypothetical protein